MYRQLSTWRILLPGRGTLIIVVGLSLATMQTGAAQQLSESEFSGKKLFVQRCSVCHMPAPMELHNPEPLTYGPKLEGFVRDAGTESAARAIIHDGTARMPGFRYGLSEVEIDNIVAYMKIFKMSDFIRPGADVGGGPDVEITPSQ